MIDEPVKVEKVSSFPVAHYFLNFGSEVASPAPFAVPFTTRASTSINYPPLPKPHPLVKPVKPYSLRRTTVEGDNALKQVTTAQIWVPSKKEFDAKSEKRVYAQNPWYHQALAMGLLRADYSKCPDIRSSSSLLKQCYNNAAGQGFDLGTQIGESPETFKYMESLFRRVYNSYTFLVRTLTTKKGAKYARRLIKEIMAANKHNAHSAVSSIASGWLEWRYAIRPLIMALDDLSSQADKASAAANKTGIYLDRSRASDTSTLVLRDEVILTPGMCDRSFNYFYTNRSARMTVSSQYTSTRRCGIGVIRNFSEFTNFHIDPIKTAWELVPYSFVVDWFIDFGERLNYVSSRFSVEPAYAYTVDYLEVTHDISFYGECHGDNHVPPKTSGSPYFVGNGSVSSNCRIRHSFLNRSPSDPPGLSIIPEVNIKLNLSKIADGFALLRQLRR